MKKVFMRTVLTMLVLLLGLGAVVPAAMATEVPVTANASSTSLYVGMRDTLYITINGVEQSPTLYRWSSSNSKIVSVTNKGVITGKKIGTATVYARRKSDGDTLSIRVKVLRNKVDNLNPRKKATAAPYKGVSFELKSVEITSPNSVNVEYYVYCNFPSNWYLLRVTKLEDTIMLYDRSSGEFEKYLVGDDYQVWAKKITGFKPRYGRSVQVIKATYSGNVVSCANIRLQNYIVDDSTNATIYYDYYD